MVDNSVIILTFGKFCEFLQLTKLQMSIVQKNGLLQKESHNLQAVEIVGLLARFAGEYTLMESLLSYRRSSPLA